jgi:DNA-binding NarL/FixJ family response regulator
MKKTHWDAKTIRALVTNVTSGTTDNVELGKMINRTAYQIYNKRKQLGLTENNRPMHDPVDNSRNKAMWTKEEDEMVLMMYKEGKKDREIAEYVQRTVCAVENRRNKLHREGIVSNLTLADPDKKNQKFIKQDQPVLSKQISAPKTEVSLLWGLVKYTKG